MDNAVTVKCVCLSLVLVVLEVRRHLVPLHEKKAELSTAVFSKTPTNKQQEKRALRQERTLKYMILVIIP